MFSLTPQKQFTIHLSLTVAEAREELSKKIHKPTSGPWMALLEGRLTEDGFKLHLPSRGYTDHRPILYGKFVPTNSGTRIEVLETVGRFDIFAGGLMVVFNFVGVLATLYIWFSQGNSNIIWYPLGLLMAFYLLDQISFYSQTEETERSLNIIFEKYKIP